MMLIKPLNIFTYKEVQWAPPWPATFKCCLHLNALIKSNQINDIQDIIPLKEVILHNEHFYFWYFNHFGYLLSCSEIKRYHSCLYIMYNATLYGVEIEANIDLWLHGPYRWNWHDIEQSFSLAYLCPKVTKSSSLPGVSTGCQKEAST